MAMDYRAMVGARKVDETALASISHVKEGIALAMEKVEESCPGNRYRLYALRALEEAAMWATKAISHPEGLSPLEGQ